MLHFRIEFTDLDTVKAREKLKPQREPYWHKLASGQFLGYRPSSIGKGGGAWIARYYDAEARAQKYHSLGDFGYLPPSERFSAAQKQACEWLDHVASGGTTGKPVTVRQACEHYAEGNSEAHMRFVRHVYGEPLAKVPLLKLTAKQVAAWRAKLERKPAPVARRKRGKVATRPRTPASVNRDMTALRAALNQAFEHGDVLNNQAWRSTLKPIKHADKSRDVYLDRAERRVLLDHLPADAAAFVRGLCVLPLRPGALAALRVGDFHVRTATLKIGIDKGGKERRIKLPPETAAMLKAQARSKLPVAPLFTRADGKAWDRHAWRLPIKDAVRAAGLRENITAYALRHSTITDLIADSVPALTVAQLSGTSVAMIERHYGHLMQEQAAAALARLVL